MRLILDIFSKTWFANIILAVCVVFLGIKSIRVWTGSEQIKASSTVILNTKKGPVKKIVNREIPPEATYAVVTEKDLFTPDRMEFIATKEVASTAEPESVKTDLRIAGRKIILYGVVITEGYKTALISNPKPEKSKRPSMWVREGEAIGEDGQVFVSSIQKEGITLQEGEKVYQILLYEKDKPRDTMEKQEQAKPTVVVTKSAAAVKPTVAVPKSESKANASPESSKENKGSKLKKGEFKIINTPFGDVKLRKE